MSRKMLSMLLAAAMVFPFTMAAHTDAAPGNFVSEGFEAGTGSFIGQGVSLSQDTAEYYDGDACLKAVATEAESSICVPGLSLAAGETYELVFWTKANADLAAVTPSLSYGAEDTFVIGPASEAYPKQWIRYSGVFTLPTGDFSNSQLELSFAVATGVPVYFDNISLSAYDASAEPVNQNPAFTSPLNRTALVTAHNYHGADGNYIYGTNAQVYHDYNGRTDDSVLVFDRNGDNGLADIGQSLRLKKNQTYYYSFWIKLENPDETGAQVCLWYNSSGTMIQTFFAPTTSWVRHSGTFTTNASSLYDSELKIQMYASKGIADENVRNDKIFLDDFYVYEQNPIPLIVTQDLTSGNSYTYWNGNQSWSDTAFAGKGAVVVDVTEGNGGIILPISKLQYGKSYHLSAYVKAGEGQNFNFYNYFDRWTAAGTRPDGLSWTSFSMGVVSLSETPVRVSTWLNITNYMDYSNSAAYKITADTVRGDWIPYWGGDAVGKTLYISDFTVGEVCPLTVRASVGAGSFIDADNKITLTFNSVLDAQTVVPGNITVNGGTELIDTVTIAGYKDNEVTVKLKDLAPGAQYTLSLSTDIRDKVNNTLAQGANLSFNTKPALAVTQAELYKNYTAEKEKIGGLTTDIMTAQVKIQDIARTGVDPVLILAVYKNGALYDVVAAEGTEDSYDEPKTLAVTQSRAISNLNDGIYTAKVFLWENSIDELKPLVQSDLFGE